MAKKKKLDKQSESRVIPPGSSPRSGTAPPKEHQWKPGQSGNQAGRDRDDLLLLRKHREKLNEKAPLRALQQAARLELGLDGKASIPKDWMDAHQNDTWADCVVNRDMWAMLNTASGDNVIKLVWEMLEGKAIARIGGPYGEPLPFSNYDYSKLSITELKALERLKLAELELLAKARIDSGS